MYKYRIGVVGAGNMARAVIGKVIESGALKSGDIAVSDPYGDIGIDGVVNLKDNKALGESSEYLLFAVKPQIFKSIRGEFDTIKSKAVISIMAGIDTRFIKSVVPDNCTVVRVMPNTPCMIGKGMICIADNDDKDALSFTESILAPTGRVIVTDESNFDAVTALSGSGPAYAYMFLDAMAQSGAKLGLTPENARVMAAETLIGAAYMALNSDKPMSDLIQAVCSKGGTTIEAVGVFEKGGLYQLVDEAMTACFNRSIELGK